MTLTPSYKSRIKHQLILIGFSSIGVFSAFMFVEFSTPMEVYLKAAESLFRGDKIGDFMPITYSGVLSLALNFGTTGIFILQAFIYVITILISYFLLLILGAREKVCVFGAMVVGLHPYLIFNMQRIVENCLTVPFIILFTISCCLVSMGRLTRISSIISGSVFAWMILLRANFIMIMPLYSVLLVRSKKFCFTNKLVFSAIIILSCVTTLYFGTVTMTGTFFILPSEGGYNIYGGANEYTNRMILENYHSEGSIWRALADKGLIAKEVTEEQYLEFAWKFIRENPIDYVASIALRVFTFFRPDYRQLGISTTISSSYLLFIVQTVLALPFLIWSVLSIRFRKKRSIFDPPYVLIIGLLYSLPFFLIMADVRYRLPIDVLFILDAIYMTDKYILRARETSQRPVKLIES